MRSTGSRRRVIALVSRRERNHSNTQNKRGQQQKDRKPRFGLVHDSLLCWLNDLLVDRQTNRQREFREFRRQMAAVNTVANATHPTNGSPARAAVRSTGLASLTKARTCGSWKPRSVLINVFQAARRARSPNSSGKFLAQANHIEHRINGFAPESVLANWSPARTATRGVARAPIAAAADRAIPHRRTTSSASHLRSGWSVSRCPAHRSVDAAKPAPAR